MSRLIDCIPTGVQLGSKRFPDPHDRPKIKGWRCDLNALSQEYNLYFVACNDAIHVYQPDFPNQKLAGEPDLILSPPVSAEAHPASGIDSQDPHSITRLCIDYLGHSEILLVACDDGDVVGYSIKEVHRAVACLENDDDRESTQSHIDAEVRVLFHRNVGASAWGLAVHREARMIAISANTHRVTVLVWALTNSSDTHDQNTDISSFAPSEHSIEHWPYPRHNDHVITLSAYTNIPSVAFNNNGDDPTGTWLFTSSIDGKTMLWDLRRPTAPRRMFELGWCDMDVHPPQSPGLGRGPCRCYDRELMPHSAWGAMMLDTRHVQKSEGPQEDSNVIFPGFKDITPSATRFSSKAYTSHAIGLSDSSITEGRPPDVSIDEMELESEPGSDGEISDSDYDENTMYLMVPPNIQDYLDETNVQPPEAVHPQGQVPEEHGPLSYVLAAESSFGAIAEDDSDLSEIDSDLDDEEVATSSFMLTGHPSVYPVGVSKKKPYIEIWSPKYSAQMPAPTSQSPCVIITKEEIFLVQHPFETVHKDFREDPIFCMRRPLHPLRQNEFLMPSNDRYCLFSQIPELGVFLVGSPEGRVGVFSIYLQNHGAQPKHGFQLEYLLPFKSGEDTVAWTVPKTRLVGVATGPVQGSLTEPCRQNDEMARIRKWRVMMYFTDHTVLSFELSKSKRGGTPELDDLIV